MDESDSEADNERRRKHLLVGDSVEVFQTDFELKGSWQPAEVVLVRPGRRGVRYSALHANDGTPFVENIPVSTCVDGEDDPEPVKPLRLCIRPQPPRASTLSIWRKGTYVDTFDGNAWWESILMENANLQDASVQAKVYVVDKRQEKQAVIKDLRLAQHWNEWTGSWCPRGQFGHDLDAKLIMVAAPKKLEEMRKDYFSFPRKRLLNLNGPAPTRRTLEDGGTRFETPARSGKGRAASNGKPQGVERRTPRSNPKPDETSDEESDGDDDHEDDPDDADAVSQLAKGKYTKASWENAKKLLKNNGWGITTKQRPGSQRKDTFYTSPAGVCYRSLPAACREWSRLHPPTTKGGVSQVEAFMHDRGQKCTNQQPEVNLKKRTLSLSDDLETPRKRAEVVSESPRLTSSGSGSGRPKNKRACMEVVLHDSGEKSQLKRTVLSWLFDMNVLPENEPVTYVNRKTKEIMLHGRAKSEGLVCDCHGTLWSLSTFESHAGSKLRRPCANIFITRTGKSLSDLQMEALALQEPARRQDELPTATASHDENDDTCGVCGDGGQLICCDHCPSTFHLRCVLLENIPEGEWFCPCCRCAICGGSEYNGDDTVFNDMTVLLCDQCEREYHIGCMYARGMPKMSRIPEDFWFCSTRCTKIYRKLRGLVGVSHEIENGLSWTLLRSTGEGEESPNIELMADYRSKLAIALCVMRECFNPMIDPRTKIDLVSHIMYNKGKADISRLNFRGFYTIILERDDEIISVAAIRVHGGLLAEMPLIGTRFQHRRQGMCRTLVRVIEGLLRELGVQCMALPAVNELLPTWINTFHFDHISPTRRLEFVQRNVVFFPGVTLLQKYLLPPKPMAFDDLGQEDFGNSDLLESCNRADDSDADDMKIDDFRTMNGGPGQVANGFPRVAVCEVSQEQNPDIPFAMRPLPWKPVIGGEAYLIDGLPQTIGSGGMLMGSLEGKNGARSKVETRSRLPEPKQCSGDSCYKPPLPEPAEDVVHSIWAEPVDIRLVF